MNKKSRFTLGLLATVSVIAATPACAQEQWPSKTIRFVVPFAAGGANDLMARAASEGATKALGQTVLIENRPGAGGTVGADIVAKSAPDGYTFLISAAGVISNSMIKKSMPFKDDALVPVAMIGLAPSVIVVPKNAPYKDLRDFVEASKKGWLLVVVASIGKILNEQPSVKADEIWLSDTSLMKSRVAYVLSTALAKSLQRQVHNEQIDLEGMYAVIKKNLVQKTISK